MRKLGILFLAAVLSAAFCFSGCSKSVDESGTTTSQTASGTETKNGKSEASASGAKSSKSSDKSSSKTSSGSKSSKSSGSKSSSASSNKSSGSSSDDSQKSENKIEHLTPEHNDTHESQKVLKVNGTDCYVGDTVSITLNIKSDILVINYEGTLSFDSEYLELESAKSQQLGFAQKVGNDVVFNASVIKGMDFSDNGTIFTVQAKVKKEGSVTLKPDITTISKFGDNYQLLMLDSSEYTAGVEVFN